MKKNIICCAAAALSLSLVLCSCSMTGEPEPTAQPAAAADPVINVFNEYGLVNGFSLYTSPDGGFSIQLPEGSMVNDADSNNVTISLAGSFETKDLINISKSYSQQQIKSTAELMELLKNDNSIDITGFFTLNKDGAYTGYKYTYTAMDNPSLKGIVSLYFNSDGSAYIVNATINNGSDETNVTNINTVIDTFISFS